MGPEPSAYVRRFDPRRDGPAFAGIVHRWTRGARSRRAAVGDETDDRSRRIDRRDSFSRATIRSADDIEGALDSVFDARAGARPESRVRPRAQTARASATSFRGRRPAQRLQAPESVSALDGAARRARSRRLDARVAGEADRAARHARDSRGPLPAADDATRAPAGAWRATSPRRFGGSIRTTRSSTTTRSATSA